VYLRNSTGKYEPSSIDPVVSEPIVDERTRLELRICRLSHCSAPCDGGTEIVILCRRLLANDSREVQVVFYNENIGYEATATLIQVHHHRHR
jgi:Rel homology dimerisation domain